MKFPELQPALRTVFIGLGLGAFWNWYQDFKSWANSWLWPDGSFRPQSSTDSTASNNSIYFSTTQNKLVYKDGSGVVRVLY